MWVDPQNSDHSSTWRCGRSGEGVGLSFENLSGPWEWDLRAPHSSSGETDPGKGHFRSRDYVLIPLTKVAADDSRVLC